jgi:hypothetical protein
MNLKNRGFIRSWFLVLKRAILRMMVDGNGRRASQAGSLLQKAKKGEQR